MKQIEEDVAKTLCENSIVCTCRPRTDKCLHLEYFEREAEAVVKMLWDKCWLDY